ncbi:hypothetical protein NQ314_005838 [Rhamnusium bicolor]|uniref:Anoctamin n=1 Tax=Rhamnusium bicolor TaxID=1586634 RepID=A0AAV8ZFQ3_9CUCU|nr:hypothetical protein NQ314_005838 [Rhamnusium bicolor]
MWVPVQYGCFFKDRKRTIDYVIVLKEESLKPLGTYIRKLELMGLELEVVKGETVEKRFLLVHIPQKALKHFAKVYNVGFEERKVNIEMVKPIWYSRVYATPISHIPPKEKGEFTTAERIIIVHKLLENANFGDDISEKGISQLIRVRLVETAYPLHDGRVDNDLLAYDHDRQLLFHHWSNFGVWYKEMPLDMIQKYFGCEIAFYFAWLEFFNHMLLSAALLGGFVVILNIILVMSFPINQM